MRADRDVQNGHLANWLRDRLFMLTATRRWGGPNSHPHFTDEETGPESRSHLPKVSGPGSHRGKYEPGLQAPRKARAGGQPSTVRN